MEAGWMQNPDAFAEASSKARLEHLRSLTLESAARELEAILEMGPALWRAARDSGVPMLPDPLPGPSLAILLGSDPPRDGEGRDGGASEGSSGDTSLEDPP